jgi:hypothetical protein
LRAGIAENALKQAGRELEWFREVRDMLDGGQNASAPFALSVRFVDPMERANEKAYQSSIACQFAPIQTR